MKKIILSIILGFVGFMLLIAEAETLTLLLLTKAIAAVLLYASYKGFKSSDKNDLEKLKRIFE